MLVQLAVGEAQLSAALSLYALGLPSSAQQGPPPVRPDFLKKIEAALPEKAPAKPARPRKVLVFTLATGYVHESIPTGARAIAMLGKKTGAYDTVISRDPAMFEPDRLKEFDCIVMVSTLPRPAHHGRRRGGLVVHSRAVPRSRGPSAGTRMR